MSKEKPEKISKNPTSSEVALGSSSKTISSQKANKSTGFFSKASAFFAKIGESISNYFRPILNALIKGDWATKLSFILMGFGFFFHGQVSTKKVRVKSEYKDDIIFHWNNFKL